MRRSGRLASSRSSIIRSRSFGVATRRSSSRRSRSTTAGRATNRDKLESSRPPSIAAASFTPFGTTIENAGAKIVSTLMAPWRPVIISLEILDSANHAAERTRFAPKLPVAGTRLSLSDLLAVLADGLHAPEIARRSRSARVARDDGDGQSADRRLLGDVRRASRGRDIRLRAGGGACRRRSDPPRSRRHARHGSGSGARPSVARVTVDRRRDRVARRDGGSLPPQTRTVSRAS